MCWSTLVFLSSLFHIACFQHSSMLEIVSKLHSFLWLNRYCIVPIYRILFIHSFVDVHFWIVSTFWLLWIMILLWTLVWVLAFSSFACISLWVELSSHMVIACLACWRAVKLLSIAVAPFYIPVSSVMKVLVLFYIYIVYLFIYLTMPGLSCSRWDLQSSLEHAGLFIVACEI